MSESIKAHFFQGYSYAQYKQLEQQAHAQEFAAAVRRRLQTLLTSQDKLDGGIPSEIAIRRYEEGLVRVENDANLLRDLIFLHDHLWVAASKQTGGYDLSAGYSYTRRGRPGILTDDITQDPEIPELCP